MRSSFNKFYARLTKEGVSAWLDRHDTAVASLKKRIRSPIRSNDIVVLVLSEASIESGFVASELELAFKKAEEGKRHVLCPIALDKAWEEKIDGDEWKLARWLTLMKKNVLDFSKWKTQAFESVYEKFLGGLKINDAQSDQSPPTRDEGKG